VQSTHKPAVCGQYTLTQLLGGQQRLRLCELRRKPIPGPPVRLRRGRQAGVLPHSNTGAHKSRVGGAALDRSARGAAIPHRLFSRNHSKSRKTAPAHSQAVQPLRGVWEAHTKHASLRDLPARSTFTSVARRPPVSALSDTRLEEQVASVARTSAIGARATRCLRLTLCAEDLFSRAQRTGARCSWRARSQLYLGSPGWRRRKVLHSVDAVGRAVQTLGPTRCCTLLCAATLLGQATDREVPKRALAVCQHGGPEAASHEDAKGAHHQHQEPCALGQGPWEGGRPAADSALLRGALPVLLFSWRLPAFTLRPKSAPHPGSSVSLNLVLNIQPLLQSWSAACKRMRPFLSEVSRKPQFNHVTFAELDVGAEGTSVRPPSRRVYTHKQAAQLLCRRAVVTPGSRVLWRAVFCELKQGSTSVKGVRKTVRASKAHLAAATADLGVLRSHSWVQELAQEQGVQALPTVQAWKSGKCIEVRLFSGPAAQRAPRTGNKG